MARWGDTERVILADQDLASAERAARRANRLPGSSQVQAKQVDVTDLKAVEQVLRGVESFIPAELFISALNRRGFQIKEKVLQI